MESDAEDINEGNKERGERDRSNEAGLILFSVQPASS
jgi:hypothetical protein